MLALVLILALVATLAIVTAVRARKAHVSFKDELAAEYVAAKGDAAKFGSAIAHKLQLWK